MANDPTTRDSKYKYEWNPFQDILDNDIKDEIIHCEGNKKPIILPRCGPFFTKNFKIRLKESGRELSFEKGEYSFIYPYMTFIKSYQNLCYAGILLHGVETPTDYYIDYSTIGGDGFVLDDVTYANIVANILNNPRTVNWENIINLPDGFPPDPHDHPANDSTNYDDLMVWLKSYLDALTGIDTSLTLAKMFEEHIKESIQKAHGGTLAELGIKNLKDYPICNAESIKGESTEILVNVWGVKALIRGFDKGEWQ